MRLVVALNYNKKVSANIMINTFNILGNDKLKDCDNIKRKEEFLLSQLIEPNKISLSDNELDYRYEVVINLNTQTQRIEIKTGKELDPDNKKTFFGFYKMSPNEKKIYFTTNSLGYILRLTIPDMLEYIIENKRIFSDEINNYIKYLEKLKSLFYKNIGTIINKKKENHYYCLNNDLLPDEYKNLFDNYYNEKYCKLNEENKKDIPKLQKLYSDVFEKIIYDNVLNINSKKFSKLNIFSLKIDGEYIHNTEYQELYKEIIYHQKCGNFFKKNIKKNKLCFVCEKNKDVSGKIDIPTKFYSVTNKLFFENFNNSNAYKSFAICEECYQNVITGINFVKNNLTGYIFNINYYLIPKKIHNINNFEDKYFFISEILRKKNITIDDTFKNKKDLLDEIKEENLSFDFLFYFTEQASFNIVDIINDVEFSTIYQIDKILSELNSCFSFLKYKVSLNDIYHLIFKFTKRNIDSKIYRKELLQFLKNIYKLYNLNYNKIISKFNAVFKNIYFEKDTKEADYIFRAINLNILLTLFYKLNILKRGDSMQNTTVTEIVDGDIKDFFEVHSDTYKNNRFRQGLFLLGFIINGILKVQKDKSATIMNKINFDGIPVNRIKRFVLDISDILKIYDKTVYHKITSSLYANMIERLHEIENSNITKDETVFYILSGISFSKYIGNKKFEKNLLNKKKESDSNDNN